MPEISAASLMSVVMIVMNKRKIYAMQNYHVAPRAETVIQARVKCKSNSQDETCFDSVNPKSQNFHHPDIHGEILHYLIVPASEEICEHFVAVVALFFHPAYPIPLLC